MSDVFGEHKDSVSRSEDLEKVEENEVKQVTMGQKDLGPMVRCLSFKYDRKPLVQHLTLLTFPTSTTSQCLKISKLSCLRVFAHASPETNPPPPGNDTHTWNILSSICISGCSDRCQFQHNLREGLLSTHSFSKYLRADTGKPPGGTENTAMRKLERPCLHGVHSPARRQTINKAVSAKVRGRA